MRITFLPCILFIYAIASKYRLDIEIVCLPFKSPFTPRHETKVHSKSAGLSGGSRGRVGEVRTPLPSNPQMIKDNLFILERENFEDLVSLPGNFNMCFRFCCS